MKFYETLKFKFIFAAFLGLALVGLFAAKAYATGTNVNAIVKTQIINFAVWPEKRIPEMNNWDMSLTFDVLECLTSDVLFSYENVATNSSGSGTINIPTNDVITPDNYGFAIKGESHLRREYNCLIFADNVIESLDFTGEQPLLAGDTSVTPDNYINSLDISNTSNHLFTDDNRNDLNNDSQVNSLDLSNIAYNIFLRGD